ncbi:MAG: amidohydrolase, partial [Desulfobacterales bacterium]
TLGGTMRYLFEGDPQSEEYPKRRFERVVSNICAAHRAEYELSFLYGHPTLVNHREMAALVQAVAAQELDPAPEIVSFVSLAGEDFSEFAARVPGAFYFLGTGNPAKQTDFPHHHPRFNIDEDVLTVGVEMHVRGALTFFKRADTLEFLKRG